MSDDEAFADGSGEDFSRNRAEPRTPRTIRFSESEWKRIDKLATEQGISSADLVRQTMIAMTNGRFPAWFDATPAAMPAGIQAQIERIYRAAYMLVTLKRDEMFLEGRQEELNTAHEDARRTQEAIMENASKS